MRHDVSCAFGIACHLPGKHEFDPDLWPNTCVPSADSCTRTDDAHHVDSFGCKHVHKIPVESAGEVVAHLCPRCDAQLP